MDEAAKNDRKKAWISWIIWLGVILALANVMGTGTVDSTTMDAEGLYFESASGYTSAIKWSDIQSAELRSCPDFGTLVEGTDDAPEKSGVWKNDAFGEYELFVSTKIENCIVCTTKDSRTVVFNFESAESTVSLYEAILKQL